MFQILPLASIKWPLPYHLDKQLSPKTVDIIKGDLKKKYNNNLDLTFTQNKNVEVLITSKSARYAFICAIYVMHVWHFDIIFL